MSANIKKHDVIEDKNDLKFILSPLTKKYDDKINEKQRKIEDQKRQDSIVTKLKN